MNSLYPECVATIFSSICQKIACNYRGFMSENTLLPAVCVNVITQIIAILCVDDAG